MRSAVLGVSGFVGKEIASQLHSRGDYVVGIDRLHPTGSMDVPVDSHVSCDVRDINNLKEAFRGVDEVYHLAGFLGTSELEEALRHSVETNVIGTLNVLEAALHCGVPRVFFASKPSVWLNTYTITKYCAEQIARQFTRYHPVEVLSLRYLNIYGPGQKLYPVRKVLPVFAAQALRGLPLQIYGDGEQTVDMIHVRDAARITIDLLRAGPGPDPLDCGTGTPVSVLELAETVNEYYGNDAGVSLIPMRKGETMRTQLVANTRQLRDLLPDLQFIELKEGLSETLDWYRDLSERSIDAALSFYGIHNRYSASWNSP